MPHGRCALHLSLLRQERLQLSNLRLLLLHNLGLRNGRPLPLLDPPHDQDNAARIAVPRNEEPKMLRKAQPIPQVSQNMLVWSRAYDT